MKEMSIKKASVVYGAAKYSTIIVQMLMSAVLARILTPSDYGIVAIVAVFTTFFSTLSNLGLGTAVMQYRDLTQKEIQHIFTFSEYFSFFLAIILCLCSYPIALFYNDMVYVPVVMCLSVSVFLNALNMIPNAILLRDQKFLLVGIRMIVATIAGGIVAIMAAIMGAKYYALVLQSITVALIQFLWNLKGSGLHFAFHFDYAPIRKVKSYSSNQFLYNIFNYFAQNLDNLLTGKLMGNEPLAYYQKGYQLMRYPVTNIAHVITPVLHPILATHQNDKRYIYTEFVRVSKALSLMGVFITGTCFWASKEIILCYYGDQWSSAVEPFRWLSICISVQLLSALFGSIYQSLGCTKEMLRSGYFHISVSLIAIIAGALTRDITVLAVFVSVSMYIKFFIEVYFLIRKCFHYKMREYLLNFIPELVILAGMLCCSNIIGQLSQYPIIVSLVIKLSISVGTYIVLLVVTKQSKYVLSIVPKKIRNKFKRKR